VRWMRHRPGDIQPAVVLPPRSHREAPARIWIGWTRRRHDGDQRRLDGGQDRCIWCVTWQWMIFCVFAGVGCLGDRCVVVEVVSVVGQAARIEGRAGVSGSSRWGIGGYLLIPI
jgi:hypothetical protein